MIEAFIFDLDDVIVNSSPLHFEAYEKALNEFGIPQPTIPADLCRSIYGMRIKEIMELLANYFKMDVDVKKLTERRNQIFMELLEEKGIESMPGLYEITAKIKKWGLKRALASSGLSAYVNVVIKKLKLEGFFDGVVTGSDVTKPKPDPEPFLKAAAKIGIDPKNCVVIEDAEKGIEAAKRAGMIAVGLRTDSDQDLSMADFVVNRLDEINLEMFKN